MMAVPPDLVLGQRLNGSVPHRDQKRQRMEVEDILRRLERQPGVILADEVGMGKTFVALAAAYCFSMANPKEPVVVMVPSNLINKWVQDLEKFCDLYLHHHAPVQVGAAQIDKPDGRAPWRYGTARRSVEFLRLLDDSPSQRAHLVFLGHGAMNRRHGDKWIRLALISEALRRHARGGAGHLIRIKKSIHRHLAELIQAVGEQNSHDLGPELWQVLMHKHPGEWKTVYNRDAINPERQLHDDPVPKAVIEAMKRVNLSLLAETLKAMPIQVRGGDGRSSGRIKTVRQELQKVEHDLWSDLLAKARWRSPLLIMDEAHHLKNSDTALARQLQSLDPDSYVRTGDGSFARRFNRMLFLTATPFQLGHYELVNVLKRFGDVRWDAKALGNPEDFMGRLKELGDTLTESQRGALALQRSWSRLRPEECDPAHLESWWQGLLVSEPDALTHHQRAAVDAFRMACRHRDAATEKLRPWIMRHNKEALWLDTNIMRRIQKHGAEIAGHTERRGLPIPPNQMLPFFLAARSADRAHKDLLGGALCSSFEAFRWTRNKGTSDREDDDLVDANAEDLSRSAWYLEEFDRALRGCAGENHPKIMVTVQTVVDLWEKGEKVLVFAFYRQTCRALRIHIGREIERRMHSIARRRMHEARQNASGEQIDLLVQRIQERYFDNTKSPGRRELDAELRRILDSRSDLLAKAGMDNDQIDSTRDVMRRFLRVPTTLARCFPLAELETIKPKEAVLQLLNYVDTSNTSWRQKFKVFLDFLGGCTAGERSGYLNASGITRTGRIRAKGEDAATPLGGRSTTLANIQEITGATKGETRATLMRAFNTPFFPDILVCSQVMGEGVDLQRFCRHVIHHDLDWNPTTIEQRTGRIDRLGCKAENRHPILVYLPFLAGTADERQYRVMSERDQWFRVVMGQDEVARLITPDTDLVVPLPAGISDALSFELGLGQVR